MADIKIETKISVLIEKINYLFHSIQMNGGSINKIDKDLLLNYVRELYELTLAIPADQQPNMMQQLPPQYQQPQYQQPMQQLAPQQMQQQPIPQQPIQQPQYFPPQQQMPSQINNALQQGYQQPPNPSEEILHPAGPSIQQSFSGKQQQKTVADIYSTQSAKQTVSEKIGKPQRELADKLRKTPIKDLKVFIGLNKRFSYINFLFNNDSRLYDEAIEKINGAPNYDEAMDYIENTLKQRLHWNQTDEMVMEFYNIVERRFLV